MSASRTALRSTSVAEPGTPTMTRGGKSGRPRMARSMSWRTSASVYAKFETTPLRIGRMTWMLRGVRPSICLAPSPTVMTSPVSAFTATTVGSTNRMPWPRTKTGVFAVPRSMPISGATFAYKRSYKEAIASVDLAAELACGCVDAGERQTHDGVEIAVDALDEERALALDPVRAG